ncbi:MAG: hypothetical protein FD131_3535 [Rhodocyclaceae bacterium]|nr:MAG: hypothetical protein FD131_3535 [Rhodocyclaceae bacterium]
MNYQSVITAFQRGVFEPVAGILVVARHKKTLEAVIATRGAFNRQDFVRAAAEVRHLGLKGISTIIATGPITYSSDSMQCIRADEEDALALGQDIRMVKMAAIRACRS